jgi:hypothetical protein
LLLLAAPACKTIEHPSVVTAPAAAASSPSSWDEVFAQPADVTVDVVVSARWAVPRKGVLDQHDPRAKAAGPGREKVPIVLPIGVVRHATKGDFIVDTGVERATSRGERGAWRGLLRAFLSKVEPVTSLGDLVEREDLQLAGVLLTHLHIDHVLGLPDVPAGTPIWIGPGEAAAHQRLGALQRRTFREVFRGHAPFAELPPNAGIAIGPIPRAIDLLGTQWGWDHDVTPGTYTDDHAANAKSLAHLRALATQSPKIRVVLGHELP